MEREEKEKECYLHLPDADVSSKIPNYDKLFHWGDEHTAPSRFDQTYNKPNFVDFLPRQQMILDIIARSDVDIPMFARQKISGSSEFTACSYKAITQENTRFMYAMLRDNQPLHFMADFDFDIPSDPADMYAANMQKSIVGAMREASACLKLVLQAEIDNHNPTFSGLNAAFRQSILYAHKPGKRSSHVVYHIDGLPMFATMEQCRFLYNRLIVVSQGRHATKDKNPLYIMKGGAFQCIMDNKIYTAFRQWRMPGATKAKTPTLGILAPWCGTTEAVCTYPDCKYHVYRRFSVQEYCANDPRFVPRNAQGVPFIVSLLTVPETCNIDLKRNQPVREYTNSNMSPLAIVRSTDSRSSSNNVGRTPLTEPRVITASSPSAGVAMNNAAHKLMHVVAQMLSIKMKQHCTVASMSAKHGLESALIYSDSLDCPYKYMQKQAGRTVHGVVNEQAQTIRHTSNHIGYHARMGLPLPVVYVSCSDQDCREFVNERNELTGTNSRRMIDLTGASSEMVERYTEAMYTYMHLVNIPLSFLSRRVQTDK